MCIRDRVEVNDDGKYVVPSNIIGKVMSEGKYSDTSDLEGFLNEKNLVSAKRIKLPSGTVIGLSLIHIYIDGIAMIISSTPYFSAAFTILSRPPTIGTPNIRLSCFERSSSIMQTTRFDEWSLF